jgi:hypothetical protein
MKLLDGCCVVTVRLAGLIDLLENVIGETVDGSLSGLHGCGFFAEVASDVLRDHKCNDIRASQMLLFVVCLYDRACLTISKALR